MARLALRPWIPRGVISSKTGGDLWFFPGGTPHSIQGLGPDGCEFLLVFDDGDFDEDSTFLLNDWFRRVPTDVLAKNFGAPASLFVHTPDKSERYIFKAPLPVTPSSEGIPGAKAAELSYTWRLMEQVPIKTKGGTVRINDSRLFPVNTTTAAALVEVNPGGLRELHWHPNGDEWLYVIDGQARLGVFAGQDSRVHSICRPAMSGTCRWQWATTSGTRGRGRCVFSKRSRAIALSTFL